MGKKKKKLLTSHFIHHKVVSHFHKSFRRVVLGFSIMVTLLTVSHYWSHWLSKNNQNLYYLSHTHTHAVQCTLSISVALGLVIVKANLVSTHTHWPTSGTTPQRLLLQTPYDRRRPPPPPHSQQAFILYLIKGGWLFVTANSCAFGSPFLPLRSDGSRQTAHWTD